MFSFVGLSWQCGKHRARHLGEQLRTASDRSGGKGRVTRHCFHTNLMHQRLWQHMAMVQNQWYRFGTPPISVYLSGDWDVHWGYRVLPVAIWCWGGRLDGFLDEVAGPDGNATVLEVDPPRAEELRRIGEWCALPQGVPRVSWLVRCLLFHGPLFAGCWKPKELPKEQKNDRKPGESQTCFA